MQSALLVQTPARVHAMQLRKPPDIEAAIAKARQLQRPDVSRTRPLGITCLEGCVSHAVVRNRAVSPIYPLIAQYCILIQHIVWQHRRVLHLGHVCTALRYLDVMLKHNKL